MTAARVADVIGRYAQRFHRVLGDRHAVCSPAGAWLSAALLGDAATGAARADLADALGCDPGDAFVLARAMLAEPPAAVAAAAAVWRDPRVPSPGLDELGTRISPPVGIGAVPDQDRADAWARERTDGLLPTFPLRLDPSPLLRPAVVVASALACRVSWRTPFGIAAAEDVFTPADDRFAGIDMLHVPTRSSGPAPGHWHGILDDRFAAHCAQTPDGVGVVSVIGAPDEDPGDVLERAGEVAASYAAGSLRSAPLADLPLGDGPAWRIEKTRRGPTERYETVLPAWSATSDHDLMSDPAFGAVAAGRAVADLLPPDDYEVAARQSVVAHYSRLGFDAAAVTAIGVMATSAMASRPAKPRVAHLEFTHPYAVVAVSTHPGPWHSVPIFTAWVTEPTPAA